MKKGRLITFFFFVQLLDIVSTYIIINHFGGEEYNPVANYLFSLMGMEAVMTLKLILSFWITYIYTSHPTLEKPIGTSLSMVSFFTLVIASLNFANIVSFFIS